MKKRNRWKVKTLRLLLIAAIVWGAAGVNILLIGLREFTPHVSLVNGFISAGIFLIFEFAIFRRLVKKHTLRITGYTEQTRYFWNFFDIKSFIIMAVMITFGLILRNNSTVPRVFIAVFYTGIGSALLTAGILFAVEYRKAVRGSRSRF